jgi:hypothetical protein
VAQKVWCDVKKLIGLDQTQFERLVENLEHGSVDETVGAHREGQGGGLGLQKAVRGQDDWPTALEKAQQIVTRLGGCVGPSRQRWDGVVRPRRCRT